ncbi:MAG TPA: sigma-70 family RNA polymerase sigma factor [Polyangiaceae bacterium]
MGATLEPCAAEGPVSSGVEAAQPVALAAIYDENVAFVWRSLRALGVPSAVLDDAVQEVFLVVHRRIAQFEGRSALKTWLFGIAYRVAANVRRAERRRPTEPLSSELTTEQPSPEQHAFRAEAARFVEAFLNTLDEDLRVAFTACVLEEMSVPEAAHALGVNLNTLYSRVRLARAKFSTALAKRNLKR